jgi:hypothetical protein
MKPARKSKSARSHPGNISTDDSKSLKLCDSRQVERFIIETLLAIQQDALKYIVKAWIIGICPRKQALFPYKGENVPPWWPDITECPFREPDHIRREGTTYRDAHRDHRLT